MSYQAFVTALAAPIVADFAAGVEPARAAELLDALFMVKTRDDARALLERFAQYGQRAEWKQYEMYAGKGWNPDPHDASVLRKAAYAIEHREEIGARGLLAFDAMRSSAIAAWACAAGLLEKDEAMAMVGRALVAEVHAKHSGWADVTRQVELAYGFADGEVPDGIGAAWEGLAWPAELIGGEWKRETPDDDEEDDDEGETPKARAWLAIELAVDCPGCGHPVGFGGIVARQRCLRCSTEIAMEPSDWHYYIADDVAGLRRGGTSEIMNDFGERFFSRRLVRKVDALACACGAAMPLPEAIGELPCRCGAVHVVREPDELARAIDEDAQLVIETRPAPAKPTPCAACETPIDDAGPIATCPSCKVRTFVGGHYPRRRATYLLSDSSRT